MVKLPVRLVKNLYTNVTPQIRFSMLYLAHEYWPSSSYRTTIRNKRARQLLMVIFRLRFSVMQKSALLSIPYCSLI